ncbi:MAG TPA: immune inhibitor A domain-containing protein, partial [Gemmataceae bacterium]|nr:immune inhibitor A domain-containing protein [Gemmataceae bacterium]
QTYGAGSTVKLGLLRQGNPVEMSAKLIETSKPLSGQGGKGGGKAGGGKGGGAPLTLWKKSVFRVAVIGIEYTDVKHNAKVSNQDWADSIFSKGTYFKKKNPTGQDVHGSLNDYFLEQSGGALRIEGKVFDWVNVGKKRGDYIQGNGTGGGNKTLVLSDALSKLTSRDGKDALKEIDGYIFIYAGDRYKTNAGAIYYPHAGTVQQTPYVLTSEGTSTMASVNSFAKIACQALGLPDLAARPDQSASRSLGSWCILSNPISNGRPQGMNPWAKEKLGWTKPIVIDPSQPQKLILSPIEDSPKECIKVLVRPNGSEYYLLENRRKKGFDSDLPGEGLLIWRVVNDRPLLCESHGIDSPKAPDLNTKAVPFPSENNSAFTPDTVPSSRSPHGGGLPVHITQIQRLPDGRIIFSIGYEYR